MTELDQSIQHCRTADGRSIAWAAVGAGTPIVLCHALGHLVEDLRSPVVRPWLDRLSAAHRLIRYDGRGSGLSDRDPVVVDLATTLLDLDAVVAAAGVDRPALFTTVLGAPTAIAWAADNPQRISRLAIVGGFARGLMRRDPQPRALAERQAILDALAGGAADTDPGGWAGVPRTVATAERAAHVRWLQSLCSARVFADTLRWQGLIDVSDRAARVRCPVLVLHSPRDLHIPFEEGRRLAGLFADARLVPFDSDHNVPYASEPAHAVVAAEMLRFLAGD